MLNFIIITHIIAIIILFFESIYIALRKPSDIQIILLVMTISTMITLVGYIVEITAPNYDTAMSGIYFSYIGKPFILLSGLLFVLFYCGYYLSKKTIAALSFLHLTFTAIVISNPYHHLFYKTISFDGARPFSPIIITHGPLYYCYTFLIVFTIALNLILASIEYKKTVSKEIRHQLLYIFGLIVSAIAGYIAFLSKITKGYDATMAGCTIGTIILFILFFRYRLFDTISLAKQQALDTTSNGILVLNHN